MDEYKLKFEIDAGNQAKHVLENPAFMSAVSEIEQEIIELWQQTENPAQREIQWQQLQALKAIAQRLESKLITAKMAARQLDSKKSADLR